MTAVWISLVFLGAWLTGMVAVVAADVRRRRAASACSLFCPICSGSELPPISAMRWTPECPVVPS